MTTIDLVSQMDFGNDESWKEFHLVHGYQHELYSSAIAKKYSMQIPEFDLSSVAVRDKMEIDNWLQVHDLVHQWIGKVTGLGYTDLQTVDLMNKTQFYDWMNYHQSIHSQIDAILGIK